MSEKISTSALAKMRNVEAKLLIRRSSASGLYHTSRRQMAAH